MCMQRNMISNEDEFLVVLIGLNQSELLLNNYRNIITISGLLYNYQKELRFSTLAGKINTDYLMKVIEKSLSVQDIQSSEAYADIVAALYFMPTYFNILLEEIKDDVYFIF